LQPSGLTLRLRDRAWLLVADLLLEDLIALQRGPPKCRLALGDESLHQIQRRPQL
jgi:hypothetical protein